MREKKRTIKNSFLENKPPIVTPTEIPVAIGIAKIETIGSINKKNRKKRIENGADAKRTTRSQDANNGTRPK